MGWPFGGQSTSWFLWNPRNTKAFTLSADGTNSAFFGRGGFGSFHYFNCGIFSGWWWWTHEILPDFESSWSLSLHLLKSSTNHLPVSPSPCRIEMSVGLSPSRHMLEIHDHIAVAKFVHFYVQRINNCKDLMPHCVCGSNAGCRHRILNC